jgi:hypothetical protein
MGAGDPQNCGACGTTCKDTQVCTNSVCVCRFPFAACGAGCADTETDPNNCGACGTVCPAGQHCISPGVGQPGKCQNMACPAGYTDCGGGSCVSTAFMNGDPANCGACGNVCKKDEVCTMGGMCVKYFAPPGCKTCPCTACGDTHTCCAMGGVPLCVLGKVCGF